MKLWSKKSPTLAFRAPQTSWRFTRPKEATCDIKSLGANEGVRARVNKQRRDGFGEGLHWRVLYAHLFDSTNCIPCVFRLRLFNQTFKGKKPIQKKKKKKKPKTNKNTRNDNKNPKGKRLDTFTDTCSCLPDIRRIESSKIDPFSEWKGFFTRSGPLPNRPWLLHPDDRSAFFQIVDLQFIPPRFPLWYFSRSFFFCYFAMLVVCVFAFVSFAKKKKKKKKKKEEKNRNHTILDQVSFHVMQFLCSTLSPAKISFSTPCARNRFSNATQD